MLAKENSYNSILFRHGGYETQLGSMTITQTMKDHVFMGETIQGKLKIETFKHQLKSKIIISAKLFHIHTQLSFQAGSVNC